MSTPQPKFREIVFQLLYSYDLGTEDEKGLHEMIMKQLAVTRKAVKQADEKVAKLRALLPEIDAIIAKTSKSYDFERIQNVEKNILRLGVYELLYDPELPPKVALSEAVRLSRKFGSPEAAAFVNALLDGIYKSSQGVKISHAEIDQSALELQKSEKISEEASLNKKNEDDDEELSD